MWGDNKIQRMQVDLQKSSSDLIHGFLPSLGFTFTILSKKVRYEPTANDSTRIPKYVPCRNLLCSSVPLQICRERGFFLRTNQNISWYRKQGGLIEKPQFWQNAILRSYSVTNEDKWMINDYIKQHQNGDKITQPLLKPLVAALSMAVWQLDTRWSDCEILRSS